MLRYASKRAKFFVQFDFLAPSAYHFAQIRSYVDGLKPAETSGPSRPTPDLTAFPPHAHNSATLTAEVQERISFLNTSLVNVPDADIDFFNRATISLTQALQAGNVREAWNHWSRLREKDMLRLLGRNFLKYSRRIALLHSKSSHKQWSETEQKMIEEMALGAAVGSASAGINACMMVHLKRRDANAVFELHKRLMATIAESKGILEAEMSPVEDVEEAQDDDSGLDLKLPEESVLHDAGNITTRLILITAYAMQDSFREMLRTGLQDPVRIPTTATDPFLHFSLGRPGDSSLNKKVHKYVHCLQTAKLTSSASVLPVRISQLGTPQNLPRLLRLYRSILDGISGPDAYLAVRQEEVSSEKPVLVPDVGWAAFLTAFLRAGRRDLATQLWDDMTSLNLKPGVYMWTALFDGYGSMQAANEALEGWKNMISQGVKPDPLTFRAIISVLFNARQLDQALRFFAVFQTDLSKGVFREGPDVLSVFNTVVHGLLLNRRDDTAEALVMRMQDRGPKPDIVTYNTLLGYFGRRGNFPKVSSIFRQITENKLNGDVFTFATILSALLKAGRKDATDVVMNLMQKQDVKPNIAVFTSIIEYLVREQTEASLGAAITMLEKLEHHPDAQPNEVTYTSVLAALHRGDWPASMRVEDYKQYIMSRMRARNIHPNRVTYHILLKACLEKTSPEGLQNALSYYRDMKERNLMNHDSWYILLHGLMDRDEWGHANEVADDMCTSTTVTGSLSKLVQTIKRHSRGK